MLYKKRVQSSCFVYYVFIAIPVSMNTCNAHILWILDDRLRVFTFACVFVSFEMCQNNNVHANERYIRREIKYTTETESTSALTWEWRREGETEDETVKCHFSFLCVWPTKRFQKQTKHKLWKMLDSSEEDDTKWQFCISNGTEKTAEKRRKCLSCDIWWVYECVCALLFRLFQN